MYSQEDGIYPFTCAPKQVSEVRDHIGLWEVLRCLTRQDRADEVNCNEQLYLVL
jgi:hypothetical protein